MRIGFVGPSYTARSTAVADEECINWFAETLESQGAITPVKAYGGQTAKGILNYFGTPGLAVFSTLPESPVRGVLAANNRLFAVAGATLYEVMSDGTYASRGAVSNDGNAAPLAFNGIQVLVVAGGSAYCFTLATNALQDVTSKLAGVPVCCDEGDTYFAVCFKDSNKFQLSQLLDGTTWPGQLVQEPSVFPENITSIKFNHRELWVFGSQHAQPYQNTGSTEAYDPIAGTLIETGNGPAFAPCLLDNSIFWIGQDQRGARIAYRSNGYTPVRVSTHAVEDDLQSYSVAQIAGLTSYAYQDGGHLFWVLYVPGSQWSWVFDVGESLWHKRAKWTGNAYQAHWGWSHVYAFGKHLIGDWNSGNLYEMNMAYLNDAGTTIRRLRRSPTVEDEKQRIYHADLTLDFDTGLGPQPPLTDGNGNPRPPQCMLRWSNDRGKTWSNQLTADCGYAGQYGTRVIFRRLGQSRGRVYELTVSDPIPWTLVDGYLRTGNAQ